MIFAVCAVANRTGWQGIPVYLLFVGFVGRIASSKIELRRGEIVVVNPLRTHSIPAAAVRAVEVNDDGTLEVHYGKEEKVAAFAYGGSAIDLLKRTSDGAAREIREWIRANCEDGDRYSVSVRWTRCRFPDMAVIASVVTVVVGALVMVLTSS
ncbi:hypothetical protein [Streptomyces sp. NRRL F-5630]|uniref:hypothetical protein n=1 Tax=unclassified Streptomyces TaxID=2593676 RepID=UPI0004C94FDA|nr:hypothetical protein [Streptomyces sp. NRRL F-5630]